LSALLSGIDHYLPSRQGSRGRKRPALSASYINGMGKIKVLFEEKGKSGYLRNVAF